ncbi:hypothetical protein O6H91_10G052700 [Diphasiastrum complanatum]|uniref:Uncharacterized protein n=2 Tax=Diphasiastrum complanatum TaxID=34168 RepID=A0ACC2CGW1_DIPCM|nr:hypothetical protein O6H91_10G052700 [Diphasiastrum complanatum]
MADEDNNTSSSSHNSPLLLNHNKRKQQQQQQQQQVILLKVPHSAAAAARSVPSPAPTPPHRAAAAVSSSCTLRPVKCPDAGVLSRTRRQQEYDSPAAAALEPLGSGSGSSDVLASAAASSLARERALLGQADAAGGGTPCANGFFPRKRKFEDILQDSARILPDGKKTLRIEDLVAGPGSEISDPRARIVHSAKDANDKKPNCDESKLEAEEAFSGGLPHSAIACSVPPSEVLEAILDNLQTKDTYGVFSEPVDETEVPDYYNVIKEPMDFGTIRDKLSKGTYVSLELFKKDVFLICSNAMHYNGPKTIYFKQARSIQNAARKTINVLERQMSGLDDYSKIAKKFKATGAKQSWKSLSTYKNSFQRTNLDDNLRSNSILGRGSIPKNNGNKKTVSNRVGKVWEEDTGAEDTDTTQFQSGRTESPFLEYVTLGTSLKGKEGRRLPAVLEYRRSSYQTLACPATTSEEFQQLLPMGCQQKHAYAQSLANFGVNFKSEAWKYVARRIQKVLAPHIPFGPGWVSNNDAAAGETLLEEVEPLKWKMKEIGKSIAGVSGQSGIGNMIHVSSVPHSANHACDSEQTILPTSRKLAPLVNVVRETSQASSLITCTDTQSQSTGSNIKAQSKVSSQTVEQSACRDSLDTSKLFPNRPIESYRVANFDAIGDKQQIARSSTAEMSFEESNRKEVNEMNQSLRVSENALGLSATIAKGGTTMQRRQPVAQAIPLCNHEIGDVPLSMGSFGVKQWLASARRANAVLDYPAFAVIPSCGENAGNEVQRVLNWGQLQVQRRDNNTNSEAEEQRLSDMDQSPQKFLWSMESCMPSRSNLYTSPERAHFQSAPLPLPDYVSVSEPRHLGGLVSSSDLLTESPQLQSASHSSTCQPWQSFLPQKSPGQFATTSLMASNNLNPYYRFPVTPQALKGMRSSQQPNLALQL